MRIAFVGKGGSGKTTFTALFTQFLADQKSKNTYAVDADLNIHLSHLLGFKDVSKLKALSSDETVKKIKEFLKGKNEKIQSLGHFKKSTPPTRNSNLVHLEDKDNFIFKNYSLKKDNLFLSIVGTYEKEKIGQSCYHNNLSILENVLSHSIDKNSYFVVDMVAGIDAFANTLHAQFDVLLLVVEPTVKSIEVFKQYKELAERSGVYDRVCIVGNKVREDKDVKFILSNIDTDKFVGYIGESEHIRNVDRGEDSLDYKRLEAENKVTLQNLFLKISKIAPDANVRLQHLYELHKKYVAQDYVKERFGDLTNQIDINFKYE